MDFSKKRKHVEDGTMLPMHVRDRSFSAVLSQPGISYRSLETSATIIERSGWRIGKPIRWKTCLNIEEAEEIIKKPFAQSREKDDGLEQMKSLVATAQDCNWFNEEFQYFIEDGAAGSVVVERGRNISIMVQTPRDDMPYFSFALTEISPPTSDSLTGNISSNNHNNNNNTTRSSDWVFLFYATAEFDFEYILTRDTFPSSDYAKPPRSPDFMALPVWILKWQVEQLRKCLIELRSTIIDKDEVTMKQNTTREELVLARNQVFQREKTHLVLHRRWLFSKELADTLIRSLDIITARSAGDRNPREFSGTLKQNIVMQQSMLQTIQHDLDMIPWSIKAQCEIIDSHINILIAESSARSAESARQDNALMKTIALLGLVFLPGNFVATIFSMTIFNWTPDGVIVSQDIWVYFVITVPLTLTVLLFWMIWNRWSERQSVQENRTR